MDQKLRTRGMKDESVLKEERRVEGRAMMRVEAEVEVAVEVEVEVEVN
jgi:hypothetical protein